jgi:hypothetical protein
MNAEFGMRDVEKEMVEYLIFISFAFDTTEPVAGRIPTSTRLSSSQAKFQVVWRQY